MSLRPEILLAFLGMCAVTFGSRFVGLSLRTSLPPFWLRFLRFVPIAVFAALIIPEIPGSSGEASIRVISAFLAALTAWRTRQLWLTVLVGFGMFWLLKTFGFHA
jgi:branched-subunit amino acid transport protein